MRRKTPTLKLLLLSSLLAASTFSAAAQEEVGDLRRELEELKRQFQLMRENYERQIETLEGRVEKVESRPRENAPEQIAEIAPPVPAAPQTGGSTNFLKIGVDGLIAAGALAVTTLAAQ